MDDYYRKSMHTCFGIGIPKGCKPSTQIDITLSIKVSGISCPQAAFTFSSSLYWPLRASISFCRSSTFISTSQQRKLSQFTMPYKSQDFLGIPYHSERYYCVYATHTPTNNAFYNVRLAALSVSCSRTFNNSVW